MLPYTLGTFQYALKALENSLKFYKHWKFLVVLKVVFSNYN